MLLPNGCKVFMSEQGIKKWAKGGGYDSNPIGVVGKLFHEENFDRDFVYKVRWDNGYGNSYREGDLIQADSLTETDYDNIV